MENIRNVCAKTNAKRGSSTAANGSAPSVSDWVADSESWLSLAKIERSRFSLNSSSPAASVSPVRYLMVEDPLHPNSISRFHFVIRKEIVAGHVHVNGNGNGNADGQRRNGTVGASSSASVRYWVRDLGSLNGLFLNHKRIPAHEWTPLRDGAVLSFAPPTKSALLYSRVLEEAQMAHDRLGPAAAKILPRLPKLNGQQGEMPYLEYVFRTSMDEETKQRATQMTANAANANANVNANVNSNTNVRAATGNAATATNASSNRPQPPAATAIPANPMAAIPEFNPNAADIARQRELDEKNRAFYARFNLSRLQSPSSTAAPTSAPIAVADDELNAALIPSWFHENEVKWQQAERQKHAKPASSAAAVAATSNASKKRKMPTGDVAMEVDDEIKPRHSVGGSNTSGHKKQRKTSVKEEEKSAAAAATSRSPAAVRPVAQPITIDDDDEDMPIVARKTPSRSGAAPSSAAASSSAAVAAASSSAAVAAANSNVATASPAAAPSSSSASPTTASATWEAIKDEFTCNICCDVMYQASVLDCSHSFCFACISEWFRKGNSKACPVCRETHRGPARPVRSMDNIISSMVEAHFSPEEKEERKRKIAKVGEDEKERAQRAAQKAAEKAEARQQRLRDAYAAAAAEAGGAVYRPSVRAAVPARDPRHDALVDDVMGQVVGGINRGSGSGSGGGGGSGGSRRGASGRRAAAASSRASASASASRRRRSRVTVVSSDEEDDEDYVPEDEDEDEDEDWVYEDEVGVDEYERRLLAAEGAQELPRSRRRGESAAAADAADAAAGGGGDGSVVGGSPLLPPDATFIVDVPTSRRSKCNICHEYIEPGLIRLKASYGPFMHFACLLRQLPGSGWHRIIRRALRRVENLTARDRARMEWTFQHS